jgi:hypothetical protein
MLTETPTRQKHSLIASDRVEGTPVRRTGGEKIGTIERLMIDKISGNVAYAVLSFGGFLGMGQKHFPGQSCNTTPCSPPIMSISVMRNSGKRLRSVPARSLTGATAAARSPFTTITAYRRTGARTDRQDQSSPA